MELTIEDLNELLHKGYVRGMEDATKLSKNIHNPYKDFKVIEVPISCTYYHNHHSN